MAAVLIVASRDAFRAAVAHLEASGHAVLVAESAADGENRLREGGIDVVVVEYELRGGIEPFSRAMERLPDPPPFVLVGASAEAPTFSARLGAAAFLTKPLNVQDLERAVTRIAPAPVVDHLDDVTTAPVPRPTES